MEAICFFFFWYLDHIWDHVLLLLVGSAEENKRLVRLRRLHLMWHSLSVFSLPKWLEDCMGYQLVRVLFNTIKYSRVYGRAEQFFIGVNIDILDNCSFLILQLNLLELSPKGMKLHSQKQSAVWPHPGLKSRKRCQEWPSLVFQLWIAVWPESCDVLVLALPGLLWSSPAVFS